MKRTTRSIYIGVVLALAVGWVVLKIENSKLRASAHSGSQATSSAADSAGSSPGGAQ